LTSSIQFEWSLSSNPSPLIDTLRGQENSLMGRNLLTVHFLPSVKIAERKEKGLDCLAKIAKETKLN
jgi:hypothetical protein